MSLSPAVLLLDLPPSALAGIDLLSFTATPRFRGVKDLPPGLHFIFTGSSTAFSIRHGLWIRIARPSSGTQQLIITRWDPATENLSREQDPAENLRWRANIGEFWREGLTPYRQSSSSPNATSSQQETSDWLTLTSQITPALLSRITQDTPQTFWSLTSASSASRDLDHIPGLSAAEAVLHPEKDLRFLPIDLKQTWPTGATGRERTEAAQDRSWALGELITQHCGEVGRNEVVGEMQFCFLMVLTLNNWSCLEQWKRILTLLFTCRKAIVTFPDLFVRAIAALRLQLSHCKDAEGGLIDLADEGGSLLKSLLVRFRQSLDTLPTLEVQDVVDELDDLEAYLKDEHSWQFGGTFVKSGVLELEDGEQVRMDTTAYDEEDESGEYAPQMVDLTPEQMKELGIESVGDLRAKLTGTKLHDEDVVEEVAGESEDDDSGGSGSDDDDEDEEEQDLEDMDARY
ncbi:hypothetical protein B0A48_06705 [Cryoendolithus antarcticus]|uniref:Uncharacterized protein n=1 Tax=Cryoendolithus antarcticus TaxID=1507870 RepID=A0A1V8T934_9PEZI|nr:hypothetical protein B0A48_06705 [Cryoendolithus antarcticus]